MGQAVLHFNSNVEYPKIENGNILSLTCIYCTEEVLFEIPEYRLKLGPFPISLVSTHGDPSHNFSIEVLETREVKIVKRGDEQAKPMLQPVQQAKIPLKPEDHSHYQTISVLDVPVKPFSNDTPPIPEMHRYPHPAPNTPGESPIFPPPVQEEIKPSPKFSETVQKIPGTPVIKDRQDQAPLRRIKVLMQQLPLLTPEAIAGELSHIASELMQITNLYKVVSEIRNWAKDIHRMDWNDTQVRALTHQLKFWSEKFSQFK